MRRSTWTRVVACCVVIVYLACEAGRFATAQEGKKPAAAGAPKLHEDATINEALIAWRGGNPDKAAELLRKAAKEKPEGFEYWAYLGRLQLQRGEDGPHIVRYGNQISARPLEDSVDVDKWRKEKLQEALGCFQKMVELKNGYTVAYGYQVICLLGLGQIGDAESVARKTVELEPKDAEWHLQLAAVLRMNGKPDEAGVVLDTVEQIAPRRGSLHQERLRVAQAKKEPEAKREELRLRSLFFTYLISRGVSEFTPDRGRLVERFGGGRSGLKAPDDVTNEELLAVIAQQIEQPDDFSVDLWLSILHHDNQDADVADAAAQALGATGPEVNDRLFWVLMNTPDSSQTQRRMAKILAARKDGRILEPLTKFLPYDFDAWPVEAATALGELRDPRAVAPLCAVCREEPAAGQAAVPRTPETEFGRQANRRRCVAALRHFDTPESHETLDQMTNDSQMRSTALASQYFLTHDPKRLAELAAMLTGPKPNFLAVHDLALLDDEAAWKLVLDLGPKSSDEQVRAHTARAIRYATPTEPQRPAFQATLERLAQDPSKIVAQEARRGLEKLNGNKESGGG
jgi:tetratricopeptide (TPR) repeat protein